MGSSRSMLFFINLAIIILNLVAPTISQGDGICTPTADYCWTCSDTGTYTAGDKYEENLNSLLSSFLSNTQNNSGFYNSSRGQDSNKIYAIALCRGDLLQDSCQACIEESTGFLSQYCKTQREAIIWAEICMVRYSYNLILGIAQADPLEYVPSTNPAKNPQQFGVLNSLLLNLSDRAASGDSLKKFAAGHAFDPEGETIYGLAQCTPDIDKQNCSNCLKESVSEIQTCCGGRQGGRVLKPSCTLRFEVYLFFRTTADSLVEVSALVPAAPAPEEGIPASPAPEEGRSRFSPSIIIVTSIVALVAVSVVLVAFYCFARRRSVRDKYSNRTAPSQENVGNDTNSVESLHFDLGTIETATSKFSDNNKLGEGGFGVVFKGTLANGHEIAVKRLSKSSKQGVQEFKNEVALVAKLQHRNLVRLLGFCLEGEETILVYEYVPNKSLDYFLFESKKREQLDWSSRCMITGGIARGILYLHEDSRLRVIHRDLKASNILLDGNMNPKISDFGMARMFGVEDQTQGNTKRIVGTYGYMAPEYAMEGLYSVKSDVFSFGVLLLEIITGRRNFLGFHPTNHAPTLIANAWQLWNETKELELMDPLLKDSCSPNEFLRYLHIGLLCVQEDANNRPTMSSIVRMLNGEAVTLSRLEKPAFFTGRSTDHHDQENAHNCSANGLTISNDLPR
ncbi:cysteine-rich receptor-like protein kinase 25 [Prunus yedoensis var. nudiflora]|uniref:Cysteine-rich receptor-like protein kinase 25 n=1 Tax=Prunus yedoensis var. nudiflora TaxID=2094558 RepID=A0A314U8F6_PRUYE|nr:cysteine-rich receptor-like protein kinase 25 [Prunus yedoensis var. nudiflora]